MKKQLLLGSALLAAMSAFPQNGRIKAKPVGIANMADRIAAKFAIDVDGQTGMKLSQPIGPVQNNFSAESAESASMPPSTINWKLLTGSMNIYGMLVSGSRPLNYNENVNAVSFVHRKSQTYSAVPAGNSNSGTIVAEISTNWGTTFDSTCVWADATNGGRYPQGGIYSAPGNTNIANAYIVATGPVVAGSSFTGDFYASKQLNAFNSTASASPNAQQFLSFGLASYPANQGPHGWSRQGFSSTNDGVVRSLALIQDDQTGLSTMRGVSVVKGTFNAGSFTWTTDSIIPSTVVKGDGTKVLNPAPQMVWNAAGTIGYVVMLGANAAATLSNKGYQPIVYKTTNSGLSWAPIPGIDFNSAAMTVLTDHLAGVNTNSNLAVPYFDGWDAAVDANGKLHIGATFLSSASNHNDSLNYIQQWDNQGEIYNWGHTPGNRPYLYDFIGDGSSAFIAKTIDSLSSEAASPSTGGDGFNDNPWDPTGTNGSKTDNVDARIQLGRTPDGQYITFSWAESDTNATTSGRKYNSLPNIKTRCMAIGSGTNMYQVSATEINVTKVALGTGVNNPSVTTRATLHYMSQTTGSATIVSGANSFTADIYTPMTVTNSNPYSQLTNNITWYQSGKLSYSFSGATATVSGVSENALNSTSNSVIYPNPASNNATLGIDLKNNSNVDITVLNAIGQLVKTANAQGQVGQNTINIDLSGLSTGIYMVNVKVGNATSTKKLVVQ